ncbi:hypothetical protein EVAR_85436_1 [Eumeta japonica]|uniref:Uncharacterized protein n=1 Tax=Eumeta variegata TaxID=151549 RepID=A0A4C1WM84_EUMVA|nr:hypothetical protein EVAR_85436_1 [Eumeta japonica]
MQRPRERRLVEILTRVEKHIAIFPSERAVHHAADAQAPPGSGPGAVVRVNQAGRAGCGPAPRPPPRRRDPPIIVSLYCLVRHRLHYRDINLRFDKEAPELKEIATSRA